MASYTFTARVNASIDTVFEVLTDHRAYSEFTALRRVKLEQEGDPAPNGAGAIRALYAIGPPIREQVTEFVRPTRMVYRMLSGAPVRDHVGTVDLSDAGTATQIVYHVDTFPKLPGLLGPPLIAVSRLLVKQLFDGIVKRSEQLAVTR
ncbi:MAG: SRPBCC family protein [Solirubrobacteraceae bacterium]